MPEIPAAESRFASGWHAWVLPLRARWVASVARLKLSPELAAAIAMIALWIAAFFQLCLDFWLASIWLLFYAAFRAVASAGPTRPSAPLEEWNEALGTAACLCFVGAHAWPKLPAAGAFLALVVFGAGAAWDRLRGIAAQESWPRPHVAWAVLLPRMERALPAAYLPPLTWPVPDWLRLTESLGAPAASWALLMGLVVQYGPGNGTVVYLALHGARLAVVAFGHWRLKRNSRDSDTLQL